MFSTDYLVIYGRAFARSVDAACANLESLDSGKHIIAQLLCAAQRPLMQSSSYRHFLSLKYGF